MPATNPLVANAQVIAQGLPALWDKMQTTTYDKLSKTKAEEITWTPGSNNDDYRVPLEVAPAGKFGTVALTGGVMPAGSGPELAQLYQTLFPFTMAFQLSTKDIYATENASLSNVNLLKKTVKDAIPNMKRYLNASFFSDMFGGGGSGRGLVGLLTNGGTPSGGVATLTFDTEFGSNLLIRGMDVEIFDNALTTFRTSGASSLPYISDVDYANNQAVVSGLAAITPGNTDYLAFPGVGATPAWASTLGYFHNTTTSGNMLGLSRSSYKGILPTTLSAGAAISQSHGYQLLAKIRQRVGTAVIRDLGGIIHPVQAAALGMLNTQQGTFIMEGGKLNDPTYNAVVSDEVKYWGINHMVEPLTSKKRIDYVYWKNFVKVTRKPLDFFKDSNGNMFFIDRDPTTGRIKTGTYFALMCVENYTYKTPGYGGFVYGATIPTGM